MKWGGGNAESDEPPPIELRFIDMFMAIIGCLVFLAMVITLVAKTGYVDAKTVIGLRSQVGVLSAKIIEDGKIINSLTSKLNAIKRDGQCIDKECQSASPQIKGEKEKWFYPSITRYWVSIRVSARGCKSGQPYIYLRPDFPIYNMTTKKKLADAVPFNVADANSITSLEGYRYSHEVMEANGVISLYFWGVTGPGSSTLYVGLRDPAGQSSVVCTVQPSVTTFWSEVDGGVKRGHVKAELSAKHPYAILGEIKTDKSDRLLFEAANASSATWARRIASLDAAQNERLNTSGTRAVSAARIINP